MSARRSLRLVLIVAGLLATAALGYLGQLRDRELSVVRQRAAVEDRAAELAADTLAQVGAAQHAYVAAGQDLRPWTQRTDALLDTLRQQVIVLDAAVARSGASMAEALDSIDRLAAADKRARGYVESGQALLAGDVIFTEGRDLLEALGTPLASARDALRRDATARADGARRAEIGVAAGAVMLWIVVALLLAPSPAASSRDTRASDAPPAMPTAGLELSFDKGSSAPASIREGPPVGEGPPARVESRDPGPGVPGTRLASPALTAVAEICSDLSALSDPGALTGALARSAEVLEASGVIVWVASNDGTLLSPVASHGFDARMMARIGVIARDSANLTAAAFREGSSRVSPPSSTLPAALAVAMSGPSGALGVFSAELRPGAVADAACVAVATIFAAQLATLALPVPALPTAEPAWSKHAQG